MSAKDKAIELVTKYAELDFGCNDNIVFSKMHKKQALIAVDEILKTHKKISVSQKISAYKTVKYFMQSASDIQNQIDSHVLSNFGYWAEVKQEIELL